MPNDFRKPEDVIAEVLGRYSMTDLREQTEADLVVGDTLFYKSATDISVIEQGETNMIRWWRIASGGNMYEVRRFENFVWCSCKGFFYSKRMCKHLALTAGVYCERCRVLRARVGKLCTECDHIQNHFLKPAGNAVVSSQ